MGLLDKLLKKKSGDYLALMAEGAYEEAVKVLEKALEENPKDPRLHIKLAECHEGLGNIEKAVEALEEASRLYTEDGFITKAAAINKKIHRLKPEQVRETTGKLVCQVEELKKEKDWKEKILPAFFTRFEKDELMEILSEGIELVTVKDGEVILREGEEGDCMYTISEGKVKVTTQGPGDQPLELAVLNPGDFFGEGSFLTGKPRTATVTAVGDGELLKFPQEKMLEIIARYPHVEEVLKEFYEKRAEKTVEAMLAHLKEE